MVVLSLILAAVAPGIALLAYFYLKDKYDAEPIRMVIRMFLIGVLIVFPTMVIQRGFMLGLGADPLVISFLISGGIEEFFKWFIIFLLLYSHSVFDEPYDGIVYAVAVALGFATLENVIYVLYYHSSFSELILRALLPVSGHALFGVVMGYYLGIAKFAPRQGKKYLALSLALPILWHGSFDYILLKTDANWIWYIIPFMSVLWLRSLWKIRNANAHSPYRQFHREEEIKF
ncbi:glutamic-type intramembrane protease PrsW [Ferviditalea candida]|uniref:Protease PrsW n=1 Tax=Ferviditalea candida TaxID=3108399 RepID=A0ABU5ZLR3_9BACL|nr:glutamic-type intramembrane protease PrsW [Paenibacillaceae bacterium T2]